MSVLSLVAASKPVGGPSRPGDPPQRLRRRSAGSRRPRLRHLFVIKLYYNYQFYLPYPRPTSLHLL